tara:strand:+ start:3917 stop:5524 length:1608 start_codon:yes stop_codon:yes gene_type:complete
MSGSPIQRGASNRSANITNASTGGTITRSGNFGDKYDPIRRAIGQAPDPQAVVTPVDAPQASPYAALGPYKDISQYNAGILRQTAQGQTDPGANPLENVQPIPSTIGGEGFYQNPFDPEGGAPISQAQWDTLKGQMSMIHRPSNQAQAKRHSERSVAKRAGGEGHPPTPIRGLLMGTTEANDEFMLTNPEAATPTDRANYEAEGTAIMKDFAQMMTRNKGELTYADFEDIGDRLGAQHEDHPGFIRNMMQQEMKRNKKLRDEFDNIRLTGSPETQGNSSFQQMEPAAQQTMKQMIQAASDPNGFMHPKLMEELGFEKMGETGEIPIYATGQDAAGNLIPATAADVAVRAKLMYGIDPTQAFQPTINPGSGEIQTADGTITSEGGNITGGQAPSIVFGVGRDADGRVVHLADGRVIPERSAPAILKVLDAQNETEKASEIRQALDIPEPKAPDAPNRTPVQPLSEGAETLFNNLTPKAEAKLKKAYEKSNKAKEPDWILDALKTLNDEFTNAKLSPKQAAALDKFVGGLLTKKGKK